MTEKLDAVKQGCRECDELEFHRYACPFRTPPTPPNPVLDSERMAQATAESLERRHGLSDLELAIQEQQRRDAANEARVCQRGVDGSDRRANYWNEADADGDIELPRCIHGEPKNVFCGKCES